MRQNRFHEPSLLLSPVLISLRRDCRQIRFDTFFIRRLFRRRFSRFIFIFAESTPPRMFSEKPTAMPRHY